VGRVRIPGEKVSQIYNGVDAGRFRPRQAGGQALPGCPFAPAAHWLVGTVGRMQGVKDQVLLARAFVRALELCPELALRARLVMIGEGPLRASAQAILDQAGVGGSAWLPGERNDVPEVMRALDCFVLPSLAEGISNTILEAMATGLPVVATKVGGNAELVDQGRTGELVGAGDAEAMAQAIVSLALDPDRAAAYGRNGRQDVERRFSMQSMVAAYQGVYDQLLQQSGTHGVVQRKGSRA